MKTNEMIEVLGFVKERLEIETIDLLTATSDIAVMINGVKDEKPFEYYLTYDKGDIKVFDSEFKQLTNF